MFPSWLEELLKQIPALGALVWLASIHSRTSDRQTDRFLNAQKEQRESGSIERKELMERIHILHEEHITARTESRQVIEKLEESMTRFSGALHEVSLAIATCPLKK